MPESVVRTLDLSSVASVAAAAESASGTGGTAGCYVVFGGKTFDLDESLTAGEVQSALVVYVKHLDDDDVVYVYNVGDLFGALYVKL